MATFEVASDGTLTISASSAIRFRVDGANETISLQDLLSDVASLKNRVQTLEESHQATQVMLDQIEDSIFGDLLENWVQNSELSGQTMWKTLSGDGVLNRVDVIEIVPVEDAGVPAPVLAGAASGFTVPDTGPQFAVKFLPTAMNSAYITLTFNNADYDLTPGLFRLRVLALKTCDYDGQSTVLHARAFSTAGDGTNTDDANTVIVPKGEGAEVTTCGVWQTLEAVLQTVTASKMIRWYLGWPVKSTQGALYLISPSLVKLPEGDIWGAVSANGLRISQLEGWSSQKGVNLLTNGDFCDDEPCMPGSTCTDIIGLRPGDSYGKYTLVKTATLGVAQPLDFSGNVLECGLKLPGQSECVDANTRVAYNVG